MIVPHRQRLEITLDLYEGCNHHCSGCMVNREIGGNLADMPEILALLKEMVQAGYVAFDLGLGATDTMSSTNAYQVLRDPVVREIIHMFHQFTLQMAMLEKRLELYDEMCAEVDAAAPGQRIRFLIPAAPDYFRNTKFSDGIVHRMRHAQAAFKSAYLNEAGFVVNCTTETMNEHYIENLINGLDVEFPVDKDDILNIPYGRKEVKDLLLGQTMRRMSYLISDFYKELEGEDERRQNPDLCYDTGTMMNLLYTDGKLYWVPFLKDDCAFIDPFFEIPRPWTMEHLLTIRTKAQQSSLEHLEGTQCMNCVYLSSCNEKGITSLMERLSIKDCMVGVEHGSVV